MTFDVDEYLLDRATDRNNNVPQNVHRIPRSQKMTSDPGRPESRSEVSTRPVVSRCRPSKPSWPSDPPRIPRPAQPITIPRLRVVHALGQLECEGRPRCYEISSHRSRSRLCSCPPPQHLLRRCTESGRWRVTGTGMASCLATVHPSGSNGNGRGVAGQSIGMVARAFIEGVGTAVGSAHAGLRRRSEMYGTAADSEARPNRTLHRSADGKEKTSARGALRPGGVAIIRRPRRGVFANRSAS